MSTPKNMLFTVPGSITELARGRVDKAPAHDVSGGLVSRRNLIMNTAVTVASLATSTAVAAPAFAIDAVAPNQADRRLLELEQKICSADTAAKRAGHLFSKAEEAMFAWRRRNPKPGKMRECIVGTNAEYDVWVKQTQFAEADPSFIVTAPDPNGDLKLAIAEHGETLSRWSARHSVARANCRYKELEAEFQRLIEKADALRVEAANIKVDTIEGLRTKARMIDDYDPCRDDHAAIADSIVADLQDTARVSG